MNARREVAVLFADDDTSWHEILKGRFEDRNLVVGFPYHFTVETASSATTCVARIRERGFYDVVVLDQRMEEELAGIRTACQIVEELRRPRPIVIIFTGFPEYAACVSVMRRGAWDYIVKQDVGDEPAALVAVDSAVNGLQERDLQAELQRLIEEEWLPQHVWELQEKYSGKLVAMWHQPDVRVIAAGADVFELEQDLKEWRSNHAGWEQPFIVQVPDVENELKEIG